MIWQPEQAPYLNLLQTLSWGAIAALVYLVVRKVYAQCTAETEGEAVLRASKRVRDDQSDRMRAHK